MELLQDAEFWVRIALSVFVLILIFAGVPGKIWSSWGASGEAVRAELDEAVRIRQEATDLLNSIKAQRQQAEAKAREIIAFAEEEAVRMAAEARSKLEETIKRREELAERKIAQAESSAAAEVKAAAADLAANLAEQVLLDRVAKTTTDTLVDKAIGQLEGRFN
ncbi:ATP F0F1 synthase subunit B [Asticcacaulis sp. 201]|uniref:F0F1 ATP synthase subunit B family protein n=1 Tax=Asticcacaulis sp. 201 TaxID=3028787 RepID=UPI0029169FA3|nr:ATP F0F1 synthase subunit B [Asticcacaulis sp. 201]MDV6329792.1 ATP F0F1 synthase subunit B [Asticcacaulis sp. 201]